MASLGCNVLIQVWKFKQCDWFYFHPPIKIDYTEICYGQRGLAICKQNDLFTILWCHWFIHNHCQGLKITYTRAWFLSPCCHKLGQWEKMCSSAAMILIMYDRPMFVFNEKKVQNLYYTLTRTDRTSQLQNQHWTPSYYLKQCWPIIY